MFPEIFLVESAHLQAHQDVVLIWQKENTGGDAEAKSEGAKPSNAWFGQRKTKDGKPRKESYSWYQEICQNGTNGKHHGWIGFCCSCLGPEFD